MVKTIKTSINQSIPVHTDRFVRFIGHKTYTYWHTLSHLKLPLPREPEVKEGNSKIPVVHFTNNLTI